MQCSGCRRSSVSRCEAPNGDTQERLRRAEEQAVARGGGGVLEYRKEWNANAEEQ